MDGLTNTLTFVHKISAGITKPMCGTVQLIHDLQSLKFYRFLRWVISGGCQVHVLVASAVFVDI